MRRRLSGALSLTLGVAGLALLYGHLLAPGRALVDRDVPFLHLPLLTDLARLARQGLPYWNPLIHGGDRKSTRLNSSHMSESRMPSSA